MINFKTIIRIIGILLLLETVMFLVCSGVSFYYRESDMLDFWKAGGITAGVGLLLAALGKGGERQLTRRDGYVLVSFAWVAFSLFGMLPFYIGGYIPDIANAFFETMSGFSSTGATILDDIESLPHGILFWRGMTQWIGGLGIIMFTIAVLPIFGVSGLQVFAAEASGPTHDKVHPRIGITAKWIWSIYAGITALLVGLLMLGGMDWFDSICHAFATTGTGGFSTKQASVAYYNSPYIEYVISIFMFISGINFTLLLFFVNRKFKKVIDNAELKFYFGSVVLFTAVIAIVLYYTSPMGMEESFRKSLFQVISLQTSTGFATDDYMQWTPVLVGAAYHHHADGSVCRQYHRRLEVYTYGNSYQSLTKRVQTHPTPQCHTSGTDKQAGNLSLHCLHRTGFLFYLYLHYSHRHTAHDGYGCRG